MSPRARIALLGTGIVLLLIIAAGLLLRPAAPDAEVLATFEKMMEQLEDRKAAELLRQTREPMTLSVNGESSVATRADIDKQLAGLYHQLTYLVIRPQTMTATVDPGGDSATVHCEFHWSVSTSLYPNVRITSERENPNGKPDEATVELVKENSEWFVSTVKLQLQSP